MSQEFINLDSVGTETKCFCLKPDDELYINNGNHEGRDVILCTRCGCECHEITVSGDDEDSPVAYMGNQSNCTAICTPAEARNRLRAGDHVAWKRNSLLTYYHHGIVESIDEENMIIFEYKKVTNSTTVQQTTYSLFCHDQMQYGNFFRINYPRLLTELNPPDMVIQRARCRLGESGYNLFFNNCESFANLCKHGVARSLQVSDKIGQILETYKRVLGNMCLAPRFVVLFSEKTGLKGIENLVDTSLGKLYSNMVGGVLYALMDGMLVYVEIRQLYDHRHDTHKTLEQFRDLVVQRLMTEIEKILVRAVVKTISFGVAASAGGVIGALVTLGSPPGILIGTGIGCVVGALDGGATVNGIRKVKWSLSHSKDASINILKLGDHVILPGESFLHPRCHAIISGIDRTNKKIKVIRNDHKRGVVEEWIKYVPMKRMVYDLGECYPVPKVLENARLKVGSKRYNIATYNCKTFAVEQKKKKNVFF